jgi:hypothetical protein
MQNHLSLPCFDEYLAECSENPVAKKVKAKRFVSRSKGWRNGKQRIRREEKDVILVKYGDRPYRFWDGGDSNMNGRIPFDDIATEVYGSGFCNGGCDRHSDDHLRQDILDLLEKNGGKF